ncbi:MAG: acyl-CoA thioesterase [Chloroflexi bacterium]|nr:acyl-CoA thioesterase [Chloroflexota bacterium]
MASKLDPRPVNASRTTISQLMNPENANLAGNVHGGHIMKLVDEAGALACMRHSRQRVVTVAVDRLTFQEPIYIGDLITIVSEVSCVGRTSMEAEVTVYAENPQSGQRRHTNTAYLVYVALDDNGKPIEVPPLDLVTDAERTRFEEGNARQTHRLSRAKTETSIAGHK